VVLTSFEVDAGAVGSALWHDNADYPFGSLHPLMVAVCVIWTHDDDVVAAAVPFYCGEHECVAVSVSSQHHGLFRSGQDAEFGFANGRSSEPYHHHDYDVLAEPEIDESHYAPTVCYHQFATLLDRARIEEVLAADFVVYIAANLT
jgi:hypothetical protein